jgi:hypothetical protein
MRTQRHSLPLIVVDYRDSAGCVPATDSVSAQSGAHLALTPRTQRRTIRPLVSSFFHYEERKISKYAVPLTSMCHELQTAGP